MFVKGDIILPQIRVNRRDRLYGLFHAAVVWDGNYDGNKDFIGIMLTRADSTVYPANILMEQKHFDNTKPFKFSNTHFVNQLFHKFGTWGTFDLVGQLTQDGIKFIEDNLTNPSPPIAFVNY